MKPQPSENPSRKLSNRPLKKKEKRFQKLNINELTKVE